MLKIYINKFVNSLKSKRFVDLNYDILIKQNKQKI